MEHNCEFRAALSLQSLDLLREPDSDSGTEAEPKIGLVRFDLIPG